MSVQLLSPAASSTSDLTTNSNANGRDLGASIETLLASLSQAIVEIEQINFQTKLLSLNARIEAVRAGGTFGAAFGIVAQEIQNLSQHTAEVTSRLSDESHRTVLQIKAEVESLSTQSRGNRLADLALSNMDLIDRNLYERSCDVRWWATDSSFVNALTTRTTEGFQHASQRLSVILDAYTVYFDLVLCDLNGIIVANGRPERYRSLGNDQSGSRWFQATVNTRSGDQFAFQSAHRSSLVNGETALIYSCGVREEGQAHGHLMGVLGVVFNWNALGQTIVEKQQSSDDQSRYVICDQQGVILADSDRVGFGQRLDLPNLAEMLRERKGFRIAEVRGQQTCIAYAMAPGFETYTTGWHCFIVQPMS